MDPRAGHRCTNEVNLSEIRCENVKCIALGGGGGCYVGGDEYSCYTKTGDISMNQVTTCCSRHTLRNGVRENPYASCGSPNCHSLELFIVLIPSLQCYVLMH